MTHHVEHQEDLLIFTPTNFLSTGFIDDYLFFPCSSACFKAAGIVYPAARKLITIIKPQLLSSEENTRSPKVIKPNIVQAMHIFGVEDDSWLQPHLKLVQYL